MFDEPPGHRSLNVENFDTNSLCMRAPTFVFGTLPKDFLVTGLFSGARGVVDVPQSPEAVNSMIPS